MILSRTPVRVSFVGGGSDLASFYTKNEYGCVISMTVKKYVYVAVNHRFDGKIRLAYARNEIIDSIDEIQNDRIKVAMRRLGITGGIEIFYISDVPKKLGLGGSSSFTVGLLNALYRYKGVDVFPERLARESCEIEIEDLANNIGKQDQYAAAIGGINYIKFWSNGTVSVKPILIDESIIRSLMDSLVFVYLGGTHDASGILTDVQQHMGDNNEYLLRMRDITDQLYNDLMQRKIDQFKYALKENWELKKKTSSLVSSAFIENLYDRAIAAGAEAGKVLGAGGGGFLMMFVPLERQDQFRKKMSDYKLMKFDIEHNGSQIVHFDQDRNTGIDHVF